MGANKVDKENVGIFSLFGKKDRQQETPAEKDSRGKRTSSSRSNSGKNSGAGSAAVSAKRDTTRAARATAMKIDAIESEMSSEFRPNTLPGYTQPGPNTVAGLPQPAAVAKDQKASPANTLPLSMGTTTQFLLGDETLDGNMAVPASVNAAVIEEAAILFANGQTDMVEQVLKSAIGEDALGSSTLDAWGMLFDLYQITRKQQEFESLSLEFANKFERSPPAWCSTDEPAAKPTAGKPSAATTAPFSGKLDSSSIKQLDRVKKLAESHRTLRLEFVRITEVDPVGCGLLLSVLKRLQKSGHELILVGAPELANKIRAILEVGRRDETEVPWLLLLEILRLLNLEKEFEEVSIDYCVTFEVSPPAFAPPETKVTTAVAEQAQTSEMAAAYMMPTVIEGRIDELILGIAAFSDEHDPAVIDCSRLAMVDFNAAGRLLTGLAPFCQNGKVIEFHNVNYLVAALFSVMGLKDIVRILPRKS
jgi:ABC-type transporter Mla MlaB component